MAQHILKCESDTILDMHDKLLPNIETDFYLSSRRRQIKLLELSDCNRTTATAGFLLFAYQESKSRFIYLTQESIAQFMGFTRQTICKTLSEFSLLKIIKYHKYNLRTFYSIEILNVKALKNISNT